MEFDINELATALETTSRADLIKAFENAINNAESFTKAQEKKEDAINMFSAITAYLHKWHPELGDMTMDDKDINTAVELIDTMAPDMTKLMHPFHTKTDPIQDFLNAFGLA